MPRTSNSNYVCQKCGKKYNKWSGKSENCNSWNTLHEESNSFSPSNFNKSKGKVFELTKIDNSKKTQDRLITKISEFDRVCGGGIVQGSAILVGGDPGIGKSTLLLQLTANIIENDYICLYISGEEAIDQIKLRADRLKLNKSPITVLSSTNVKDIIATIDNNVLPDVLIIDSIQTMYVDYLDASPGTVSQVRSSAQELIRIAKQKNIAIILVGHVTKEGQIAGPRILEHMVDTVLYFEGDLANNYRILRSVKNRFGSTDEIGVFEMTDIGLIEVSNPSKLFLTKHEKPVNGSTVFTGIEGSRPILVEIQALVAPSSLPTPRRAVVGWDSGRLAMILAVLESSCNISISGRDVYLNVAGGYKIREPAADLAIAASLISSFLNTPFPIDSVVFGEISLSGEIRAIKQPNLRLKEAFKLGFKRAYIPNSSYNDLTLKTIKIDHLSQLSEIFNKQRTS